MKQNIPSLFFFKRLIILLFILSFFFYNQPLFAQSINNLNASELSSIPKYENLKMWAAHPWKKDFSDSVPKGIINEIKDTSVDVFFIHPTTYTEKTFINWNADINDIKLNDKTDYSTILYQASVFNASCRVFCPRYRQAHLKSFYINNKEAEEYFDTAYEDIKNAFIYYLENFNNGRPIIIASHSQGTKHAGRLLKEFFEGKELQKKLVCAYLIGMPIPENYFTKLNPCIDSTETGCFVGWRTFKKGYTPDFIKKEKIKSIVVNPLSWTIDNNFYSSKMNKGGVIKNFNKIIPKIVSAKIHDNILWSCKPKIIGKVFIVKKNYHIGDINLFYINIRQNVRCRIKEYNKINK